MVSAATLLKGGHATVNARAVIVVIGSVSPKRQARNTQAWAALVSTVDSSRGPLGGPGGRGVALGASTEQVEVWRQHLRRVKGTGACVTSPGGYQLGA